VRSGIFLSVYQFFSDFSIAKRKHFLYDSSIEMRWQDQPKPHILPGDILCKEAPHPTSLTLGHLPPEEGVSRRQGFRI